MTTLQLISTLVAIAAIFGWISARWLRLPLTIGTVLLTVVAALGLEVVSAWVPGLHGYALGLVHQINFENLILHGMLPLLLFAGAFLLDVKDLFQQKLVVGVLSTAGTVLSAAAMAVLMHWFLGMLGVPAGWLACMLFGALIAPTDPIAVLEMLRRVGAPRNLQAQLAGESLFNDGVGAVIFLTVLAASHGARPTAISVSTALLLEVGGALALGVMAALATSILMRFVSNYQVDILLTLALALGGYAAAEAFGFSAPLEAVIAAIALRWFNQGLPPQSIAAESIGRFWEVIDEVQNSVLFVLLGLELLAIPFAHIYLATGGLAIIASLAVRTSVVALLLGALRGVGCSHGSSVAVLSWGGLRGGLSLALALTVPASASNAWILPTTYCVVVFTIVVQGSSMNWFLQRRKAPAAGVHALR